VSILIDASTRILVQGITGGQARFDTQWSLEYGARIVAGVTPGKAGETVHGVPVYGAVTDALSAHAADLSVIYVPPAFVKAAATEAIAAGVKLLVITAEHVPVHDALYVFAAAREAGARVVGCNTNGMISPGRTKVGGVGGMKPDEIFAPGSIGVCSRSGGMTAEIALTLKTAGLGISTSIGMGGDAITGTTMAEFVELFERDPDTHGMVIFGEPGTANEAEVAALIRTGRVAKPVVALLAGAFQERYPCGQTFGHAAAMIASAQDTVTAKKRELAEAGASIAASLDEVPALLRARLARR
jgi:succinyl-CoA synthetase alpha subunit